jgi:demethylmenaquinone methyltransferase/2-methoxy-6-polyprenyl-1,4-benzoquinol methylase
MLALDASPETLEIARRRVPPERMAFTVGDAYAPHECIKSGQRFDAAFAGFWWSHVPRARLRGFLLGLHACLEPGARVVFLDNRFVPGSSTPVSEDDAQGDTWQLRRLDDGSTYRVLKNFPSEAQLREAVAGLATGIHVTTWAHYWALDYAIQGS